MFYKLDENKNVVPSSMEEWASFINRDSDQNYRHVGDEVVNGKRISTVFLGLCHNYNPHSKIPIVFETMVFNPDGHDSYQTRCATWDEAVKMHETAVQWVKDGCNEIKFCFPPDAYDLIMGNKK